VKARRRTGALCGLALAAACCLLPAACARRVTQANGSTVVGDALHSTITIRRGRSVAIIGRGAFDPSELGLPLYPDAIPSRTGAWEERTESGIQHVVTLTTRDGFAAVYAWYRVHMPPGSEQTHFVASGGSVASFSVGTLHDPDQRSVIITQSGPDTVIQLERLHHPPAPPGS
jgi:hypothetical protein